MPLDVKQKDQFEWPSILVDNPLTEDMTDRILLLQKNKKSKRLEDMASQVARERTEYREETLSNIASLIEQKIVETLLNGESVITDYFTFEPNIQGSFDSKGEPLDANKIKYSINMSVRPELRNILNNQVRYKITDSLEQGGAAITSVEDQLTGAQDGVTGRGHIMAIYGNKIKVVGATGADKEGHAYLSSELEVDTEVQIAQNDPSCVTILIPNDLAEGKYKLRIETYYSNSKVVLKNPRTIVYPGTITIQ